MKKKVLLIIMLLLMVTSLLSGCIDSLPSSDEVGACIIIASIGVILFILLVAYLLGGKKTVVYTQQASTSSTPVAIKQESKSDRRCPDCGRIISDEANSCKYCGKKFKRFSDLPVAKIYGEVKDSKDKKTENQEPRQQSPEKLYKKAHNAHYKDLDIETASNIYNQIIKRHPNSDEAEYSKQQIENIEKMKSQKKSDKDKPNTNNKSIFCFECGKKLEGIKKFCPFCGTKQDESK